MRSFLLPFSTSLVLSNENQSIDVAAIVEDRIILKSDLIQLVNMSVIQNKLDPLKDMEKIKVLEKSVLESMIDQKLF